MEIKQVLHTYQIPNVNVNKTKLNNVNNVKDIALKLSDKLSDPNSYRFFCKVAWKLPEHQIWANLEQALTGKNPKAYFTFLCNRELVDKSD